MLEKADVSLPGATTEKELPHGDRRNSTHDAGKGQQTARALRVEGLAMATLRDAVCGRGQIVLPSVHVTPSMMQYEQRWLASNVSEENVLDFTILGCLGDSLVGGKWPRTDFLTFK